MSPSAYVKIKDKEYFIKGYVKIFYNCCALRPSCYECVCTITERQTDLTIGDFGNIDNVMPDFYNTQENSLFLIHTNYGKVLFDKIKDRLNYRESNIVQCLHPNLKELTKKSKDRDMFWDDYYRKGIEFIMKKYGKTPLKMKIKNKIVKLVSIGEREIQKVTLTMLTIPKGGQHNELEAA